MIARTADDLAAGLDRACEWAAGRGHLYEPSIPVMREAARRLRAGEVTPRLPVSWDDGSMWSGVQIAAEEAGVLDYEDWVRFHRDPIRSANHGGESEG
jgi:hypothetical protein